MASLLIGEKYQYSIGGAGFFFSLFCGLISQNVADPGGRICPEAEAVQRL